MRSGIRDQIFADCEFEDLSREQKRAVLELKKLGRDGVAPRLSDRRASEIRDQLKEMGFDWDEACRIARLVPFKMRYKHREFIPIYQQMDKYEREYRRKKLPCEDCVWAKRAGKDLIYCPSPKGCWAGHEGADRLRRHYGTFGGDI